MGRLPATLRALDKFAEQARAAGDERPMARAVGRGLAVVHDGGEGERVRKT